MGHGQAKRSCKCLLASFHSRGHACPPPLRMGAGREATPRAGRLRLTTMLMRSGSGRNRCGMDSHVRRPMMTALRFGLSFFLRAVVSSLKYFVWEAKGVGQRRPSGFLVCKLGTPKNRQAESPSGFPQDHPDPSPGLRIPPPRLGGNDLKHGNLVKMAQVASCCTNGPRAVGHFIRTPDSVQRFLSLLHEKNNAVFQVLCNFQVQNLRLAVFRYQPGPAAIELYPPSGGGVQPACRNPPASPRGCS